MKINQPICLSKHVYIYNTYLRDISETPRVQQKKTCSNLGNANGVVFGNCVCAIFQKYFRQCGECKLLWQTTSYLISFSFSFSLCRSLSLTHVLSLCLSRERALSHIVCECGSLSLSLSISLHLSLSVSLCLFLSLSLSPSLRTHILNTHKHTLETA